MAAKGNANTVTIAERAIYEHETAYKQERPRSDLLNKQPPSLLSYRERLGFSSFVEQHSKYHDQAGNAAKAIVLLQRIAAVENARMELVAVVKRRLLNAAIASQAKHSNR